MFQSIEARQRERSAWNKKIFVAGAAGLCLLAWTVRYCVTREAEQSRADARASTAAFVEYHRERAEQAQEVPALVETKLPGMSIVVPGHGVLDDASSHAWGRLETSRIGGFLDPYGTGVIVEWREGDPAKASVPLPGDPVDKLFTYYNGNYQLKRGEAEAGRIGIALNGTLHGIATYGSCNGRIVVVLVWSANVLPLFEQVTKSFRCEP